MPAHRLLWLFCALLALAGLILAYRVYTTPTEATVIVEWSTASELDTAGFNLYRSDSSEGPFTRVNDDLIPASPDPLIGGSYTYTDTNVTAGQRYYYQLEDVETGGTTTRHGPVEVEASAPGRIERLAAAALIGAAILGFGALALARRKVPRSPIKPS